MNQSIFNIGYTIWKRLKKRLFTKGYEQIWNNRTYQINSIEGVRAALIYSEIVKLNDLQKISGDTSDGKDEVAENEKMYKLCKAIKREGLDEKNLLEEPRLRMQIKKNNNDYKLGIFLT